MSFDDLPLFRRTDPVSSADAALGLAKSGKFVGQKRETYLALMERPGSTSAELALHMGVDRYVTARRLPDLARDGFVRRGMIRICRVSKSRAVTWLPWPDL